MKRNLSPSTPSLPRLQPKPNQRVLTGLFAFTPVVSEAWKQTYSEFLDGMAAVSLSKKKTLIYQPVVNELTEEHSSFFKWDVDARILIGEVNDPIVRFFRKQGIPIVVIGDHLCHKVVWSVDLDYRAIVRQAVDHLWNLGHRRIALFHQIKSSKYQDTMIQGFKEEVRERKLNPKDCCVISPVALELQKMLSRKERRPTAIITVEAGRSTRVLDAVRVLGLHVPRDLSIFQCGGIDHELFDRREGCFDPRTVTKITSGSYEMGAQAIELAIRLAENGEGISGRILVRSKFIEGQTCIPHIL